MQTVTWTMSVLKNREEGPIFRTFERQFKDWWCRGVWPFHWWSQRQQLTMSAGLELTVACVDSSLSHLHGSWAQNQANLVQTTVCFTVSWQQSHSKHTLNLVNLPILRLSNRCYICSHLTLKKICETENVTKMDNNLLGVQLLTWWPLFLVL